MTDKQIDRLLTAVAVLVALAAIGLMSALPASLLQVNPVYRGF